MNQLHPALPPEFRASSNPSEMITVWRGDKLGREVTGMMARRGDIGLAEADVLTAARGGVGSMNQLIDRHTDAHHESPLLSVTTDLNLAQLYASRGDEETIYEFQLPAKTLIADPYHIGRGGRDNSTELFVPGYLSPSQLAAVKMNNDHHEASELMYWHNGFRYQHTVLSLLAYPRASANRTPNPAGLWDRSKHWQKAA